MAGRTGLYDPSTGKFEGVTYMPCTEENHFIPELPREAADIIYLCFPNNPTGEAVKKEELQKWVDYANAHGSVIIFDAAYESYITSPGVPHSIYECEGAKTCAIELRSFSKKAGFTGLRLGFCVIPETLERGGVSLRDGSADREASITGPLILSREPEKLSIPRKEAVRYRNRWTLT